MSAVKVAISRLDEIGIPYERPSDYLAEMVKSDAHMARIKDRLLFEKKKMAAVEERKRKQLERKENKKSQVAHVQESHRAKREALQAIEALKKSESLDSVLFSCFRSFAWR